MSDKERAEFEAWYANYFDGCCAVFGGIDCTNPKGVADDAWQASAARYQSRIAELEAEVVRLKSERADLLSVVVCVASEFVGGDCKITYRLPDAALDYIKNVTVSIKIKYQSMKGGA